MKKKYITPNLAVLVYHEEELMASSPGFEETDEGIGFGFPDGSGSGSGNDNGGFDSKRRDSYEDDDYDPLW